jgi:hypothetical protein
MIRNIIDELDSIIPERNKHQIIEQRVVNAVSALINIKQEIRNKFIAEEAEELIKRIDLAVRGEDPRKFTRKIREFKETTKKRI